MAAILLLLSACIPITQPPPEGVESPAAPEASANPLLNATWLWTTLVEQPTGASVGVPSPKDYTLVFNDDGSVEGKADCKTFAGTYSQQSGLVFTISASSSNDCGEASLAQQYLQLLGTIVAGGPDGAGGLALETAGGAQRMLFLDGGPSAP